MALEREWLLALLREEGERHGRAMTCRAWDGEGLRPSSTAIRRRLGGWREAWRKAGWPSGPSRKRWREEEILARLREAGEEAGRALGRAEWSRERRRPSVATIVSRFGSWCRAWRLAGFPCGAKRPPLEELRRRLERDGLTARQRHVLELVLALGSESAAARELGVTSQAVSQAVRKAVGREEATNPVASQGARPRGR